MKQLLDYLLSIVYLLYFWFLLGFFHVLQVICFRLAGRPLQKRMADLMNGGIAYGWLLTGSRFTFQNSQNLPANQPLVFVANHQSMFDISPIAWFLRRHSPIFVSKIELAHGLPSVSYNLRKSQAALIDRNNPKQAISEIGRLGKHIQQHNYSAVIFPEGTRSASGTMRPFAAAGVAVLLKRAPSALVVPIAIEGTGRFNPKGMFPLRSFSRMAWTVLPPIDPAGQSPETVVQQAQEAIAGVLGG